MAQYASLEEAFGGKWGTSKNKSTVPKEQDVHSSQKTYNSPTRRTEAAITQHADLIKHTMKSLPFGDNDDNYAPARVGSGNQSKNQIEPFYVTPSEVTDYRSPPIPGTGDWSYASTPTALNQSLHFEAKLDKLMRMIEGGGGETPSTHDLLLYVFTGVFSLFLLDSFVTLGKISRR
jgi:hypothetical protein